MITPSVSCCSIVSPSIIPHKIAKIGIKYVVDELNKAEVRLMR